MLYIIINAVFRRRIVVYLLSKCFRIDFGKSRKKLAEKLKNNKILGAEPFWAEKSVFRLRKF